MFLRTERQRNAQPGIPDGAKKKNGIPHPFDTKLKVAGSDWLKGFLQRHPSLTLRAPENTSLARARGFNRESVGKFFDLLERITDEHDYPPSRIWNLDETGVSTVSELLFIHFYYRISELKPFL